jgi:hypothetical protein
MDVPCRVSAERIELQLIRAAPGNPNPAARRQRETGYFNGCRAVSSNLS